MSDYKRFFSYVYAYENSTKTTNSGFAKIETRGEKTDIELHMQRLNIFHHYKTLQVLHIHKRKTLNINCSLETILSFFS